MVLGCTKLRKVRMEDRRIAFERKTQCTLLPFFFFFFSSFALFFLLHLVFFRPSVPATKSACFSGAANQILWALPVHCESTSAGYTLHIFFLRLLFVCSASLFFFCAIFTIVGIEKRPLFFFLVLSGLLLWFSIFCASVRLVVVPACRTDSHAADLASGVHLCSRTRRTAAAARLPRRACCVVQHQDRGW